MTEQLKKVERIVTNLSLKKQKHRTKTVGVGSTYGTIGREIEDEVNFLLFSFPPLVSLFPSITSPALPQSVHLLLPSTSLDNK